MARLSMSRRTNLLSSWLMTSVVREMIKMAWRRCSDGLFNIYINKIKKVAQIMNAELFVTISHSSSITEGTQAKIMGKLFSKDKKMYRFYAFL